MALVVGASAPTAPHPVSYAYVMHIFVCIHSIGRPYNQPPCNQLIPVFEFTKAYICTLVGVPIPLRRFELYQWSSLFLSYSVIRVLPTCPQILEIRELIIIINLKWPTILTNRNVELNLYPINGRHLLWWCYHCVYFQMSLAATGTTYFNISVYMTLYIMFFYWYNKTGQESGTNLTCGLSYLLDYHDTKQQTGDYSPDMLLR